MFHLSLLLVEPAHQAVPVTVTQNAIPSVVVLLSPSVHQPSHQALLLALNSLVAEPHVNQVVHRAVVNKTLTKQ